MSSTGALESDIQGGRTHEVRVLPTIGLLLVLMASAESSGSTISASIPEFETSIYTDSGGVTATFDLGRSSSPSAPLRCCLKGVRPTTEPSSSHRSPRRGPHPAALHSSHRIRGVSSSPTDSRLNSVPRRRCTPGRAQSGSMQPWLPARSRSAHLSFGSP